MEYLSEDYYNPVKKIDLSGYMKRLKDRSEVAKKTKVQSTRHQQDAIDTAKMFKDFKSLGIYMMIFKKYPRYNLLKCRDWVQSLDGCDNRGKIFVASYKKFVYN